MTENTLDFNKYLDVLNKEQKAAVCHEGKSLLILAGAGSGKTRVITTKIAYLISQKKIKPSSILAVTFTRKAANEMKERAVALEPLAQYSQIRTFHSFGAFFLRNFYFACDLDKNFTVYDDDDVVNLITKACPQVSKKEASHYAHLISLAKDYCFLPDDANLIKIDGDPAFPKIYSAYQNRLHQTGNVDFGDLILLPYLILKNDKNIREKIHNRYKVIMVDEYQDSNVAQFNLLQELSGVKEDSAENPSAYVCVVGDDDQSIYKFRGAEVQNILNFQKQFPGTDLIRLETNYRSSSEILVCAGSVVKNNKERLGKTLVSAKGKGKKPTLVFLPNQDDETDFCSDLIEQSHENGTPYSSWAILYRTNAQSLGFETTFMHRKIPYQVVGSLKFYEREEVKDIIAWLSFIANPKDLISFERIVNKPSRGIGETSQNKIIESCAGKSILEADAKLSKKANEGFLEFCSLCKEFEKILPSSNKTSTFDLAEDALLLEDDLSQVADLSLNAENSQLLAEDPFLTEKIVAQTENSPLQVAKSSLKTEKFAAKSESSLAQTENFLSQEKSLENQQNQNLQTENLSLESENLSSQTEKSVDENQTKNQQNLQKQNPQESENLPTLTENFPSQVKNPQEKSKNLSEFIKTVIEKSGLEELYKSSDELSGTQKVSNLHELENSAIFYPCTKEGLLDFLDHVNLDRTLDSQDDSSQKDKVTLITLHNTKGLEFSRVIITGMEAGIFPREGKSIEEIEEERRIFYVGITRAKDELYFTSCSSRRLYGHTNFMLPSPFLKEIDKKYLRILGQKPDNFENLDANENPFAKKFYVGARIFHDDYGEGQVIKHQYSPEGELVITVSFLNSGIKKFIPKFQEKSLIVEDF